MVNITLVEFHADDGSFSANLPFSGIAGDDAEETDDELEEAGTADDDSKKGKGLAVFGVFLLLIAAAAAVRYLTGDDELPEPEVDIDADEVPAVDVGTSE